MFNPGQCQEFHFLGAEYDQAAGEARLKYRFDEGIELVECITFPYSPWPQDSSRQVAFFKTLELLHLIAGISYYKAACPRKLVIHGSVLDDDLSEFLQELYVQGLGEFAYVNDIDIADRVDFYSAETTGQVRTPVMLATSALPVSLPERALVAMGGGKDSLVSLELIRDAGIELLPICVGQSELIANTVKTAGLPLLSIKRALAPELKTLNEAGAWNGHVPVTAINSAILLCASFLYGYGWVVFSNEKSASEATRVDDQQTAVNHQYSKSLDFEQRLRDVISNHISPDLEYFSLLRPLSEMAVVQRFSQLDSYHQVFSSCNRNFHLDGSRVEGRWCLDCPKCRFATLALAVYKTPGQIQEIFGDNLLDKPEQIDGFRALCDLGQDKPFECVGEIGECRSALMKLSADSDWSNCHVVKTLAPELKEVDVPDWQSVIRPGEQHCIPQQILAMLKEVDDGIG